MDKQQIISFIETQLRENKISKEDLVTLAQGNISLAQTVPVSTKEESSKNLINTFYAIGAIIAVVGVSILVGQNWDEIGFAGRIIVTLGISFITYVFGYILRKPEQRIISEVMFTIAAALAPLGSYVLLKQAGVDFNWATQFSIALSLGVLFAIPLFITKRNILLLLTVAFLSWAYYSIIANSFDFGYYSGNLFQWSTILLGAAYLFIGYGFRSLWAPQDISDTKEKKAVQNILTSLGTLGILGAGITIGGAFDLFFIVLIFAAFYGSVYLKSRSMLTYGAIFLIAHIVKLTYKYFVNSLGWPVALIGIGFLVIGIGYGTFYLNRKFISVK